MTSNAASTKKHYETKLAEQEQQLQEQAKQIAALQRQIAWFERQIFGRKSEKRLMDIPQQAVLEGFMPAPKDPADIPTVEVPAHKRRKTPLAGTPSDSGLRFDENQVPVKQINVAVAQLCGKNAEEYEIIRYEHTYRLAQRRASYVVLKYTRPIFKHKPTQTVTTAVAPSNVLEKSYADVSFIAGMLIDKFIYHQPLYRQHQRLKASYIEISRATLTHIVEKSSQLLEPIAQAIRRSILQSRILALDETPTKAGRQKHKNAKRGSMRTGYYWPMYGDRDEVYFSFSSTRAMEHVHTLLNGYEGTVLTDGYAAYESYAAKVEGITHALCWVHTRRGFEKALEDEPELANHALDIIGGLYAHETRIKELKLEAEKKQSYRAEHSKELVDYFFTWCASLVDQPDLVAMESPIIAAVKYALHREKGLREFLQDPDLPLDTNHVERTLRVMPLGRKNWNFSWTELGAHYVGIIQTLLCTCKLQDVDPYTYLVDVLQRVGEHPASEVHDLTPRLWKEKFADNSLKSDLDKV